METWRCPLPSPTLSPPSFLLPLLLWIPHLQAFAHAGPDAWSTLPPILFLTPPTFEAPLCCHLFPCSLPPPPPSE